MEKTIKEPLELELTSCNKKVTLQWENRVKGLIKIVCFSCFSCFIYMDDRIILIFAII